ncbi:MAG: aminoacyl-tRNA hydrolase [Gammaproteobacteria bacterium]
MKQILILRTKYPSNNGLRKGKLIAQGAHASVSAVFDGLSRGETKKHVEDWFVYGQAKIAVYVHSEEELLELWNKIQSTGLACSLIKDSGKTEFGGIPTLTAIGFGPAPTELIDPITRHLPLL